MIQNHFVKLNIILEYTYFTLYYIDIDTYTWTETKHVFQFSVGNLETIKNVESCISHLETYGLLV